jgi:hypothetical protein
MAKQNNSLTELQALEGIYEHLSTIDDLAKDVGMISTRLRKIEEQLKEPVNITDPILAQDLPRDTCIYGALAKSMEACREIKEQELKLNDTISELKQIKSLLEQLKKEQTKYNDGFKFGIVELKNNLLSHMRRFFCYQ